MDIVEVGYAVAWETIADRGELELGHQAAMRSGEGRYDNRPDAIGNGVSCEDEDGTVTPGRRREPDFTALHRPSRPSLQRGPNRRWLSVPARPRRVACRSR